MNNQNISSPADNQNPADAIKMQTVQDIKVIENLVQTGAMTHEQGLNLMNFVIEKAYGKMLQDSQNPAEQANQPKPEKKEIPEFFNRSGRSDVFDYLNNSNVDFDDDEILKISSIVENIEKNAIDRYLKEQEHEKTLNDENESAKQRLRANAQNSVYDGATNGVFTREKIGKMSGAEFAKNERAIFEQLRKGLIK